LSYSPINGCDRRSCAGPLAYEASVLYYTTTHRLARLQTLYQLSYKAKRSGLQNVTQKGEAGSRRSVSY